MRQALGALSRAANDRFEHERRREGHAPATELLDQDAGELARTDDCLGRRRQEADRRVRGRAVEGRVAARAHSLDKV